MADKKLNINITTKGAAKSKNEIKGLDSAISTMGKAVGIASAAYFGAKGLISGFSSVINLAGEQERAEKSLEIALGRTSTALLDQASALQQVTTFGDEAIIGVQASIGAFLDSEEQIKKATEATLDIAVAMGMDLKSAGDLVAKTLGSSTNAMSRYGIEVVGAVGSTERLESLTNNVANLFGGQASAQAKTLTGSIEQMKNALGDAGEVIGELLAPMVISVARGIKTLAENVGSVIERFKDFGKEVDGVLLDEQTKEVDKFRESLKGLSQKELLEVQKQFEASGGIITLQGDALITYNEKLEAVQAALIGTVIEKQKEAEIEKETTENTLPKVIELREKEIEIVGTTDVAYQDYVKTQKENVKTQELEEQMIARFIEQYPELAKQLGLVKIATDEAGYSWETFNDNLDTAIASSIASASAISSTTDALGAAKDAAKQASISFVSGEIQKAVALYIRKFLATTPLPPVISAPLALAGGAAFGSLMSSAISRNFADGGIVDGDPSKGDVVPAMLTAGEVILNQAQQDNLVGNMGGVTVNIQGNMIGNEEFVRDILIPEVQKTTRRNLA